MPRRKKTRDEILKNQPKYEGLFSSPDDWRPQASKAISTGLSTLKKKHPTYLKLISRRDKIENKLSIVREQYAAKEYEEWMEELKIISADDIKSAKATLELARNKISEIPSTIKECIFSKIDRSEFSCQWRWKIEMEMDESLRLLNRMQVNTRSGRPKKTILVDLIIDVAVTLEQHCNLEIPQSLEQAEGRDADSKEVTQIFTNELVECLYQTCRILVPETTRSNVVHALRQRSKG